MDLHHVPPSVRYLETFIYSEKQGYIMAALQAAHVSMLFSPLDYRTWYGAGIL